MFQILFLLNQNPKEEQIETNGKAYFEELISRIRSDQEENHMLNMLN
jgi:hypothetical protein